MCAVEVGHSRGLTRRGVRWIAEHSFQDALTRPVKTVEGVLGPEPRIRTYAVAWADVVKYGMGGVALECVILRNRRRITLQGIDPGWFGNMSPAEEKITQLQAYQAYQAYQASAGQSI